MPGFRQPPRVAPQTPTGLQKRTDTSNPWMPETGTAALAQSPTDNPDLPNRNAGESAPTWRTSTACYTQPVQLTNRKPSRPKTFRRRKCPTVCPMSSINSHPHGMARKLARCRNEPFLAMKKGMPMEKGLGKYQKRRIGCTVTECSRRRHGGPQHAIPTPSEPETDPGFARLRTGRQSRLKNAPLFAVSFTLAASQPPIPRAGIAPRRPVPEPTAIPSQ